ncbi:MAG: type 2 lanthipeptide synthetase LanM, partial [Ktedonobacteraceae bacterium]
NTHGCQPAFRTFKLLNKDTHGWCECIAAQSCASQAEIERFYQRLGGYLALLYALEATDFHVQNLIAAGEDPMLIDLETLFHPRFRPEDAPETICMDMINHSVLRVGLLPQRVLSDGDSAGFDLSGLTGQAKQMAPFLITTWQGQGTDEMHAAQKRMEVPLGEQHRPKLRNQEIETLDYKQSIIAGFTSVYQLLLEHREELLTTILPRFTHDEVRVLVRPTQQYVMLQNDSTHPNVLRDALDRDRIFERLWLGTELEPHLAHLILAERADLWREDIPKFTTRPDSRDLFTAHGETIINFFPESSQNLTRKCIQRMGERDLTRQVWIIQASLSSLALNANHIRKHGLHLHSAEMPVTNARLLAEAQAIGERLEKLALTREDTANWLGVNVLGGREWNIMQANLDIYGGLPGITLFLAHLGKLTGEERFTKLARLALQTLRMQMRFQQVTTGWSCIGAFNGAGSVIYLFSHLSILWHEPALYQEATKIVAQ